MLKIAITGSSKLAGAIIDRFNAEPIRIEDAVDKHKYDVFINNAHIGFSQTNLLKEWFDEWKEDSNKLIVNISSRAAFPNLSQGYIYAAQKAALDHLADNLTYNSYKKCRITTLNLGWLKDDELSLSYAEVCDTLEHVLNLPAHIEIPRLVLQHSHNYLGVQLKKNAQIGSKR